MIRFFPLILVLFSACSHGRDNHLPDLISGSYENTMIAVNPGTNVITGYYESRGGGDETLTASWDCTFYFSGQLSNNATISINAVSYFPSVGINERTGGKLTITKFSGLPAISIKLDTALPGCSIGEDFTTESPTARAFEEKRDWVEIRLVNSRKAFFYATANALKPRKAYVTSGD